MAPGSTRTNSLGKFTARRGRKRTSNVVKVKYEAPTAKNQRNQIMRNAKTLAKISKKVLSSRVFCDWQFVGQLYAKLDAGNYTTTWGAFPLMDTNSWRAVLRMDENVAEGSKAPSHWHPQGTRIQPGPRDKSTYRARPASVPRPVVPRGKKSPT